ncbi:MAG: PQQ-binding-like beta-propeller repeat protein [Planctomycetota bacterium]
MCDRATAAVIVLSFVVRSVTAADWPQFLGPHGSAKSADHVPLEWSDDQNVCWKTELPGPGSSSPIVVGPRVFVTCYTQQDGQITRFLVCVDKQSGKELWTRAFRADRREDAYEGYLTEHGYASNTPTSDGAHVFVFFGKGGVHSLDPEGNIQWSVDVGQESSNRRWGSAASLLLVNDTLIVNAAEESQAILALDKTTGKQRWRQEAEMLELAYGTPRLVSLPEGRSELVISVPGELWALHPSTGKLNWYVTTPMTGNVSPSVIVDGDTLFSFGGFRSSGSVSVRAGGTDDVSDTHVNWISRGSSYVATPLLHAGRFYWIDDRGMAMSQHAATGEEIYRERVAGLSGRPVYASPVLIGDHIYVVTRNAGTIVYRPTARFQPVARNQLASDESDFNASPAVSESRLYLRSNHALYCIGT